jgi:KEOPS complex subunit Pcc1
VSDPSYVHQAVYSFTYPTGGRARVVADAIAREVDEIADDRSRATVSRDGRTIELTVAARDLVALRAASNTWVGLVEVAERTAGSFDPDD